MTKPTKPASKSRRPTAAALTELIDNITEDANGADEQLSAFQQAFEDEVRVPCQGFVVGEPVAVVEFEYDGNERRGLTVQCLRPDGSVHTVALADIVFPPATVGEKYVAAYRKWMGLKPFPTASAGSLRSRVSRQSAARVVDPVGALELIVLSVKKFTARCRTRGSGQPVHFRVQGPWELTPGEILTVKPTRRWRQGGKLYLSGEITSSKIDAAALDLTPLRLQDCGVWEPAEEYWGEDGDPIANWAKPIIAHGTRRTFEMEQVLPGYDFSNSDDDPIGISNDLRESGDSEGAYNVLMILCEADLRCLDAHSHLGNLAFVHSAKDAIRHYEVGVRIGELSLGARFNDVLPWGCIDNRPFLRCMHGFGLCLWRLGRFAEAERIFNRMLWLNPTDNQGARVLLGEVRAKRSWEEMQDR